MRGIIYANFPGEDEIEAAVEAGFRAAMDGFELKKRFSVESRLSDEEVILAVNDGMTTADIARASGKPYGTAWGHVDRLRKRGLIK